MGHQKEAVDSGYWPLYRLNPAAAQPLHLDSRAPKIPLKEFTAKEARFSMLERARPVEAEELAADAQEQVDERRRRYEQLEVSS